VINVAEGLKRVATTIRWLGYLLGGGFLLIAVFTTGGSGEEMAFFCFLAALVAAAGWVVAWIIEGFARPKA
jgi:hypothetical protein